jgi:hypothetical protein
MSTFEQVFFKPAGSANQPHMADNMLTSTIERIVAAFVAREQLHP